MSSPRSSNSSITNNSYAIRQEISRFESVHPSIYTIYDLIEAIDDKNICEQIREHVLSIEDSFVNSQEWSLSRSVVEIKLGVLGSPQSGKGPLVHRYLTSSYLQDESPDGGRFKKEVDVEGQSALLLIRDEGGPPDMQFSNWVDGVILVFSVENEESFNIVCQYYNLMTKYRNTIDMPLILVGTQDAISESNPRRIDDVRSHLLPSNLQHCTYHETCATYGLNVDKVFQEACAKIFPCLRPVHVPSRPQYPHHNGSRPATPQHALMGQGGAVLGGCPPTNTSSRSSGGQPGYYMMAPPTSQQQTPHLVMSATPPPVPPQRDVSQLQNSIESLRIQPRQEKPPGLEKQRSKRGGEPPVLPHMERGGEMEMPESWPHYPHSMTLDPSGLRGGDHHYSEYSRPPGSRGSRERNSFLQDDKKGEDDKDKGANGIGVGRAIPLKQGYLYKRSTKGLNKEWKKKKYVTLSNDAILTYHANINDYMGDKEGKNIDLKHTTVKIPGVAYRQSGGRSNITSNGLLKTQMSEAAAAGKTGPNHQKNETVFVSNDSMTSAYLNECGIPGTEASGKSKEALKKRNRRNKSTTKTNPTDGYDSDGYEFVVVSMNNQQWHFETDKEAERDNWVKEIETAIHNSLQLQDSARAPPSDPNTVKAIQTVSGNHYCADCGQAEPVWASLNLGTLVCIECSGVHRQLGTHISRVRSLGLDDWQPEYVQVMKNIGNTLANSVWEAAVAVNAGSRKKPEPRSSREEKEAWIRAKYEGKQFLAPVPFPDAPIQQQLIDAMARQDTRQVILCLALASEKDVNAPYSKQDQRAAIHIAATLGNVVYIQLLLWYGGNPKVVDHEGRNAFFYAMASEKRDCATFLRQNGCPEQYVNNVCHTAAPVDGGGYYTPPALLMYHNFNRGPAAYLPQQQGGLKHHPKAAQISATLPWRHTKAQEPPLPPPHSGGKAGGGAAKEIGV